MQRMQPTNSAALSNGRPQRSVTYPPSDQDFDGSSNIPCQSDLYDESLQLLADAQHLGLFLQAIRTSTMLSPSDSNAMR
jgi:hypothetical protein